MPIGNRIQDELYFTSYVSSFFNDLFKCRLFGLRCLCLFLQVFWSDSGELCCIATEDSFFILKYSQEAVSRALENKDDLITEDGIEDAFEVIFLVL